MSTPKESIGSAYKSIPKEASKVRYDSFLEFLHTRENAPTPLSNEEIQHYLACMAKEFQIIDCHEKIEIGYVNPVVSTLSNMEVTILKDEKANYYELHFNGKKTCCKCISKAYLELGMYMFICKCFMDFGCIDELLKEFVKAKNVELPICPIHKGKIFAKIPYTLIHQLLYSVCIAYTNLNTAHIIKMDVNSDKFQEKANKMIKKMEEMFMDIFSSYIGGWQYYIMRHKEQLVSQAYWILAFSTVLILITYKMSIVFCVIPLMAESLTTIIYSIVIYACK